MVVSESGVVVNESVVVVVSESDELLFMLAWFNQRRVNEL